MNGFDDLSDRSSTARTWFQCATPPWLRRWRRCWNGWWSH